MLAVWGIVPVVEGLSHPVSRRRLSVAALLMGGSGWFRPECLALAAIVIVVWLPIAARRSNLSEWAIFSGLTLSVVAGFLALNFYIFGNVLGMHAIPVTDRPISEMEHLREAVHLLEFFASGVARFAPVVLLLPILAVRMMYPVTWRGTVPFYFLVVCGALFLVAVWYMVPTEGGLQWGPRHVIPVVPLLSLAVGIGWQSAALPAPRMVYARTCVFALVLIGYGTWLNMWVGARTLRHNYTLKILPTIQLVRANGADQIVVTDQSTAQEMAALMQDHRFYLAPINDNQPERLAQLADAFLAAGRQRFLVIFYWSPRPRTWSNRRSLQHRMTAGHDATLETIRSATSLTIQSVLIPAFAVAPVSVECEMHYIARDQPIALLLAVFVLVEVGSHIAGVTFDASTLPGTWQFLDESLLVNDLGRSLWYPHAQPPAFNLFLGIVLKLAARHAALVFHFAYVAMDGRCVPVFSGLPRWSAPRGPSRLARHSWSPSAHRSVLYEHWLFYTLPEAALLMWMAIGAGTLARNVTPTHALRFSTTLAVLCLTRSLYHAAFGCAVLASVVLAAPPVWRVLRWWGLGPALAVVAVYAKNLLLFGTFATSSWMGMNLAKMTVGY